MHIAQRGRERKPGPSRGVGLVVLGVLCGVTPAVASTATLPSTAPTVEVATPVPAPRVAVLDVPRLLQDSRAGQSVRQQLEQHRARLQTETEAEETTLRKMDKNLQALKGKAPPATYAEREQALRDRVADVERKVQTRRRALDRAATEAMDQLRRAVLDTSAHVARERQANIVLIKQQVLWSDPAMDITDTVLKRLDTALPHVAVPLSLSGDSDKP